MRLIVTLQVVVALHFPRNRSLLSWKLANDPSFATTKGKLPPKGGQVPAMDTDAEVAFARLSPVTQIAQGSKAVLTPALAMAGAAFMAGGIGSVRWTWLLQLPSFPMRFTVTSQLVL